LNGSRIRRTSGIQSVGRPDRSLGRSAKITVEMASDGGASWRSETLAAAV
jgi:hypothetical protein